MLTTLETEFKQDETIKLNLNTGSLMHGVLMENIDRDYGEYLHQNGMHPYSQFIYWDKDRQSYIWRVSTLNSEAKYQIIDKIQNLDKIYLKHRDITLEVKSSKVVKEILYKELANEYFLQNSQQKKITIKFITPATFKTQGEYVIFPSINLIYKNLLTRWNSYSKDISLEDEETENHLINYTKMIGYKLRSTKYQMEGVKINAFMGEVCYMIKGPLTLVSIANLLYRYSEFSGIGAKTSIGMGGVKVE